MCYMSTKFVSYRAASKWAKTQKITTLTEWNDFPAEKRPPNIPKSPDFVYKKQWQGWSAFLDNGRRKTSVRTATYEQCRKWARENNIQTAKQWYTLKDRLPPSMPTVPDRVFKGVWTSWPDFLGTNKFSGVSIIERVTRLVLDSVFSPKSEEHRKQFAIGASKKRYMVDMLYPSINLVVEYDGQFYHLGKESNDVRKTKDLEDAGWKVVRIREGKLQKLNETWDVHFNKCRYEDDKVKIVLCHIKSLCDGGLLKTTATQSKRLARLVENLDLHPFYQKMGVYNEFVTYEECKEWAIKHKITGEAHWREFRKKNDVSKIPSNPERTYRGKGWINWPTFLENGQRSKKEEWATYQEASLWAQQNNIKSAREWYRLGSDRPTNMPTAPESTYKDQWVNWPTFLKNGNRPHRSFVSYEEASLWAKQNGITTGSQWIALKNRPENLPRYPDNVYIEEWVGWAAFLGVATYRGRVPTKKKVRKRVTERKFNFVSMRECAVWAKSNGVKTSKDWKKLGKTRPSNIPSDPPLAYKKEWTGWPNFFNC